MYSMQMNMVSWSVKPLIQDIWQLASLCDSVQFSHVFSEANFLADALANLGHGISFSSLRIWPPFFCRLCFLFQPLWACVL